MGILALPACLDGVSAGRGFPGAAPSSRLLCVPFWRLLYFYRGQAEVLVYIVRCICIYTYIYDIVLAHALRFRVSFCLCQHDCRPAICSSGHDKLLEAGQALFSFLAPPLFYATIHYIVRGMYMYDAMYKYAHVHV